MNRGKETSSFTIRGTLTPERIFEAVRSTPPDISNKGFLARLNSASRINVSIAGAEIPSAVAEEEVRPIGESGSKFGFRSHSADLVASPSEAVSKTPTLPKRRTVSRPGLSWDDEWVKFGPEDAI